MAYAFNEDRSKVDVYTADQIDEKSVQQNQAIADEASTRSSDDAVINSRIDTLVDHGTGGIEVRTALWQDYDNPAQSSLTSVFSESANNFDCLEYVIGKEGYQKICRTPVIGGVLDFVYAYDDAYENPPHSHVQHTGLIAIVNSNGLDFTIGDSKSIDVDITDSLTHGGHEPDADIYIYAVYGIKYAQDYSTEVADIRVGYDSSTWPTAGDAVRGQIENLAGLCKKEVIIHPVIEVGNVSQSVSGWTFSSSTSRMTLKDHDGIYLYPGDKVLFTDTTYSPCMYYSYKDNDLYYVPDARWLAVGEELTVAHEGYYMFCLRATAAGYTDMPELATALASFTIKHYTNVTQDVENEFKATNVRLDDAASETYISISHQGYKAVAPKSTIPAYIKAMKRGYRYVENDVSFSSDNEIVMWHDSSLFVVGSVYDIDGYPMYTDGSNYYAKVAASTYRILNSDGTYSDSTVDENTLTALLGTDVVINQTPFAVLRRFDVGRYVDSVAYAGTQMATFREWISACKLFGLHAYIDHKIDISSKLQEMFSDLTELGMVENVSWICGTNDNLANSIRSYDTNARIVVLFSSSATVSDVEAAVLVFNQFSKGRGISFEFKDTVCSSEIAKKVLENGYGFECYYEGFDNTPKDTVFNHIKDLLLLGVQRITLDKFLISDAILYLF